MTSQWNTFGIHSRVANLWFIPIIVRLRSRCVLRRINIHLAKLDTWISFLNLPAISDIYLRWTQRSGQCLVSPSNQFSVITFGYRPSTNGLRPAMSGHVGPIVAWICYRQIPISAYAHFEHADDLQHLDRFTSPSCPNDSTAVFDTLHSLAHLGVAATAKLILSRFFWLNMRRNITAWVRSCVSCQKSKVHKHICEPLGTFSTPDARFSHVHIDLVGPWPVIRRFEYLLTCIDRFTRWPDAIPLYDVSAESIAQAPTSGCISVIWLWRDFFLYYHFSFYISCLSV